MGKVEEEEFDFEYQGRRIKLKAEPVSGSWGKFVGKMFSSDKEPIVFGFNEEQIVAIHMFFVFMPLLVVWFDDKKKVTRIEIMKPFGRMKDSEAKFVLEIPLKNKLIKDFEHIEQ